MTIRVLTNDLGAKVGRWIEYHNVHTYQQVENGLKIEFKDGLLVYISSFTNIMEVP